MDSIKPEIKNYVESYIIPQYAHFDEAHNIGHVKQGIENSLEMAQAYDVDFSMVYVIAAYHDIGLPLGRAEHNKFSAEILLADKKLEEWFTKDEIKTMAEAVEDHRASISYEPRSIYGKIIADADNDLKYKSVFLRCIQHGIAHFPEYDKNEHFLRIVEHMKDKYGPGGYLKTWLNSDHDRRGLQEIRDKLSNLEDMRTDFDKIWEVLK